MTEQCTEIKLVLSMEEALNFLDHDDLREFIWEKMPQQAQSAWLTKMIRRRELETDQRATSSQAWISMADQEYKVLKLIAKLGPVTILELKQTKDCPSFSAFDRAFMDHLVFIDEERKYHLTKRGEQFIAAKESTAGKKKRS